MNPSAEQQAIIDEYGELCRELDLMRPVMKRACSLKEQIVSWYADAPADASFTVQGKRFEAQIGPCENRRCIVAMEKLYRKLGMKAFLAACSFALGKLDALFPNEKDRAKYLVEDRTGPRSVDVVALR